MSYSIISYSAGVMQLCSTLGDVICGKGKTGHVSGTSGDTAVIPCVKNTDKQKNWRMKES